MTRINNPRRRRTRGMAMVEMIFVLPVLLLIVFTIAEFGLMFSRWLTLSNAVREGARAGVVYRQACTQTDVETAADLAATSYAKAGGVGLTDNDVNVTGECGGSDSPLKVAATFPFKLNIPFFSSFGTINLSYTSTMRNE